VAPRLCCRPCIVAVVVGLVVLVVGVYLSLCHKNLKRMMKYFVSYINKK
jgi:hypothetical protein